MATYSRYALITLFLAFSCFGGYATMGSASRNGLGTVLKDVVSGSRSTLLGAPEPFKRHYTGIAAVDSQLSLTVAFFSAMIDGDVSPENMAFYVWGMTQFAAGWTIMLLESVRAGNKGRLVSYASIFGLVLQNISWVVTLPLWLSLHLLTSPISKIVRNSEQSVAQRLVSTYHPWDTVLVPLSVVQAFVVPAILMSLPSGFLNYSVATHYGWNAVWQAFPLWNVLILALLRRTPLAKEGNSGGNEERGRRTTKIAVDETQEAPSVLFTYSFALILAAGVHLPILALSLLPTSLRLFLASHSPVGTGYLRSLLERGTFMNIFIPSSWPFGSEQPSVSSTAYASGDLAPLATQFLQYDLLVASVPFFLWALYLRQTAIRNANVFDALGKAAYWLVLGGPHAAVIILLRERDIALSGHGSSVKKVN